MSEKKSKLGKGLGSIFGDNLTEVLEDIQHGRVDAGKSSELEISEIRANPYQPRTHFDEEALKELSASIKEHGVFTPILVRKSIQGYEIIAGERRWRASKKAGLKTIPAMVVDFSDEQMMEVSILENVQRENLNPMEEALAYQNLSDRLNYTQEKVAERLGKSRVHVTNMMRLLKLPQPIQELVSTKKLSIGHARPLISLDEDDALDLAERIIKERLSVREVEQIIKSQSQGKSSNKKEEKRKDPNLVYVENLMELKLQTAVVVENHKIQITYTSDDDLNRILELLGCIEE
ncbi:MAG: ParB/RepB/Spo0J family partition protein [Anaerorhabdus sp.]